MCARATRARLRRGAEMLKWVFGVVLFAAIPAAAQIGHEHRHPEARPAATTPDADYSRFVDEMNAGMARMMKDMHAPGGSGDPDVDFLAMMIPHHEGAVEMARLVLIHGRDAATRKLAEDIIANQVAEIESMKRRLAILRANTKAGTSEFPALGGTRGPTK